MVKEDNYQKLKIVPLKEKLAKKYSFDTIDMEDSFGMLLAKGKITLS